MLCYIIWLFVKRLSQKAIQRRSQRDRLVKIKVFKLRRDADDIPCNITFRSAGGESLIYIYLQLPLRHIKWQIVFLPTYLPGSNPAVLLKVTPPSTQHFLESMLFLAHIMSLASGHLLSPVPPFGILYHNVRNSLERLSLALNPELTSSALPRDHLMTVRLQYAL